MRCFLPAKDPVVLKRKYAEGLIRPDKRLCDSLGRDQYGRALLRRKIQQRRDMPTRDDAALTNLELPRVDHGQRVFAFVNDHPSFFATRHTLTEVARISYGKFDQLRSPNELVCTRAIHALCGNSVGTSWLNRARAGIADQQRQKVGCNPSLRTDALLDLLENAIWTE